MIKSDLGITITTLPIQQRGFMQALTLWYIKNPQRHGFHNFQVNRNISRERSTQPLFEQM